MRNWWIRLGAGLLCLLVFQLPAQTLLVVGDSISAGYGIEIGQGWVMGLQQRLDERGLSYQVVNASISGDTTAGGRSRLPALLEQHQPQLVIIELGGNDGLRGLPLERMQDNLQAMIELSRQHGSQVLLLGMRIPPNYGPRYSEGFYQVYQQLGQQPDIVLVDFLLDGIGGVPGMIQHDGIHPVAAAQPQLLENVWTLLEPMLANTPAR